MHKATDRRLALESLTIPPIDRDEAYKDIFEQAENFKKTKVELFAA